jgi:hypothetical protein
MGKSFLCRLFRQNPEFPRRDGIELNHHRASGFCFRIISAQTRPASLARKKRYTRFPIML